MKSRLIAVCFFLLTMSAFSIMPRFEGVSSWSSQKQGWPVVVDVRDSRDFPQILVAQERGDSLYLTLAFQGTSGRWTSEAVLQRFESRLDPGSVQFINLADIQNIGRRALIQEGFDSSEDVLRISLQIVSENQNPEIASLASFFLWSVPDFGAPPQGVTWTDFLTPLRRSWFEPVNSPVQSGGYLWVQARSSQELVIRTSSVRAGDEVSLKMTQGQADFCLRWISADGRRFLPVYQGSEGRLPLTPIPGEGFWRISLASKSDQTASAEVSYFRRQGDFSPRNGAK